jgi:hypothetical protein
MATVPSFDEDGIVWILDVGHSGAPASGFSSGETLSAPTIEGKAKLG